MKNLFIIASCLVLGLSLVACETAEKSEADRFLEARVEQFCFSTDYENENDFSTFTEEDWAKFEQLNVDIMNQYGFNLESPEDFIPIAERVAAEMEAKGEEAATEFEEKYYSELLSRGCVSEEEVEMMRNPQNYTKPDESNVEINIKPVEDSEEMVEGEEEPSENLVEDSEEVVEVEEEASE